MSRRPTDCDSKPTPEPSVLDAGTESAAVSLTLTAATENNTASRPSAGRDRPGVPVLSDTVDPALAAKGRVEDGEPEDTCGGRRPTLRFPSQGAELR
jgi:hypothetical protein